MRLNMSFSALPLPFSTTSPLHHPNHPSPPPPPPPLPSTFSSFEDPPKAKTIRYRLSQLCKQGQVQLAQQLFDTIPQPTTVLWNTMIIGFICNNMPQEAVSFYSLMKYSSLNKCDPYTYSSTLKACAETKQIRVGKAVHGHIIRSEVYPSRIVYNSLLNMYAACLSSEGSFCCDLVNRVFKVMPKRNVVSWNTMISWYAKTKRYARAVSYFLMMMRCGIRPSVVSFVNVFPAVSGMGHVDIANALYGLVIKLGSEFVSDLFVVSSAIFMYAELGCINLAKMVFDTSFEKNTEVWNSMIGGYVHNNCPLEALNLFLEALKAEENVVLDVVTFLSVLTAASQLQQLEFAQQIHAYLIKNSLVSRVVLLNAIVAMYSRCNCVSASFRVFIEMQERDVVSWNTVITALVQNGMDYEGLMLVYEMQKQGFMIDEVTVTAVLSAASNLRDLEIGKQIHAYLLRHCIQFEGMESYLVDMYSKSGLIHAAQKVFEINCADKRDQATWNAMIAGNTQNGLIDQSFSVFRQMLEQDVSPNAVTLASILPACSQSGSIALGKVLHGFAIRNFLNENVFVASALVDMYSKSGAELYAENVFKNSCEKNSVTYTNMILGYGQHGMGEKAVMLFYSLRDQGLVPDSITFVAVLSACSYAGLVEEGLQIFKSMEIEYGVKPLPEHYACVVDMLGRVGRVTEAYEFTKGLGKDANVLGIWGSLLAACRIHRHYELGKVVANKLLELERGDRVTGYHVLLSNIYAEEQNWEFVNSVREGMQERGLTKEVGCSWIDISGYPHSFASRDKKHPRCYDVYDMLEMLASNMKDAGYRHWDQS